MTLPKLAINRNLIFIILIIVVSLAPRFWMLTKFPPIIVDEPANLRDIDRMIRENDYSINGFQWDGSQATLAYLPTILLIKLGITDELFALRLSSVFFSILALVTFYFLVKRHSNNLIAFSTTLMFSCSYYFLQFSRVGWGAIYPLTLGLFALLIVDSIKEKISTLKITIIGILLAIIFYLYRAGEVLIFSIYFFTFFKINLSKEKISKKIFSFLLFSLIFFICIIPWLITIKSNIDFFILRQRVVSIQNTNRPYHGKVSEFGILTYQIESSLKSWLLMLPNKTGNIENSRYLPENFSTINLFLIPLFIFGFILGLTEIKKFYPWFMIYFLAIIFGQVFTVDPPNGARGLIMLPIIYFFISLALNFLYQKFNFIKNLKWVFLVISIIIALMDFEFYQFWMSWIKV